MGYATKDEVKAQLRLTGAANDTEVEAAIADFDTRIDSKLQIYEKTLPLTSPPNIIKKVSKFGACSVWLVLNPTAEVQKDLAATYERLALEWLDEYIQEKYHAPAIK